MAEKNDQFAGVNLADEIRLRKKSQYLAMKTEEKLDALLQTIPVRMTLIDPDGNIVASNNPRMVSNNTNLFAKKNTLLPNIVRSVIGTATVIEGQENVDGRQLSYVAHPVLNKYKELILVSIIETDLTEKLRQQESTLQAQKMESIGKLASGIAHDFNNKLGSLAIFIQLALEECPVGGGISSNLLKAQKTLDHAKNLAQQILTFARGDTNPTRELNPVDAITESLDMLRGTLPPNINIIGLVDHNMSLIKANPIQIQQIVVNICSNAKDAIGADTGTIIVRLENTSKMVRVLSSYQKAHFLRLTISDDGPGIAPQIINRIFEPFFTTKKKEKGIGLGLSMVHGIVNGMGGEIFASSEPDLETTFEVLLPITGQDTETAKKQKQTNNSDYNNMSSQKILVVDDEQLFLAGFSQILTKYGHEVYPLSSPQSALDFFEQNSDKIDLVITDFVMPEMNGDNLSQKILSINPETKIIISSGNIDSQTEQKLTGMGVKAIIRKPFIPEELFSTIRGLSEC